MPGIPPVHSSRCRGTTPIKSPQLDDVWHRALYVLGLQELNAPVSAPSSNQGPAFEASTMASPIASPTTAPVTTEPARPPVKKLTFSDLPLETKKEIFKHVSTIARGGGAPGCGSFLHRMDNELIFLSSDILPRPYCSIPGIEAVPRPIS